MTQYIDKDTLVAELEKLIDKGKYHDNYECAFRDGNNNALYALKAKINTLEVKDPYEQCVQHPSVKDGIKAHAETYSFNIESELFNQLTKEQQALWRKEIERACISGGEVGVELARDPRYKENLEVKEVDLEKEIQDHIRECLDIKFPTTNIELIKKDVAYTAKKFFELGLKARKGE